MSNKGWIGVDFDGTLAEYAGWISAHNCGAPVAPMVAKVKQWLAAGKTVKIFTARVFPLNMAIEPNKVRELHGTFLDNAREDEAWDSIATIREFCRINFGEILAITNVKDYGMIELWDDRCIQVMPNTGELAVEVIARRFIENQAGAAE